MLSNIIGPVTTSLQSLWALAYPSGPILQVFTGAEWLAGQDAANRVVWVPTRDRYDGIAKQTYSDPSSPVLGGGIPRNLRNRQTTVEIHIWGAPPSNPADIANYFDNTEQLIDLVVQAIHQNCHGIYRLLGGEYPPQTREPGFTQYGRLYVLHVEFETPIPDASNGYTLTSPTAFPITEELNPTLPPPA